MKQAITHMALSLLLSVSFFSVNTFAASAEAQESADSASWRQFQHALGAPALIGANATHPQAHDSWRPIPPFNAEDIDADRFRLGFQLFHEGRLSSGNSVACISCHAGPLGGVDGLRLSMGVNRARGNFNSLSLFNAAFNFRQFWDGRSVTLEDQLLEPIVNEVEMANTLDAVLATLQEDEQYRARFTAIYADGVSLNNMADAMGHFQRINFTRIDSAFMHYLNGDPSALSEQAVRGMQRFRDIGCVNCHNGINLGGNSYQQLGAAIPYYGEHRQPGLHDMGIQTRSLREQDRHVFKVPGLHTVAATAPYFHDGSIATLEQAITEMAEHQLGRELSKPDVDDIAAFLRALLPATIPLAVDLAAAETTSSSSHFPQSSVREHSATHQAAYREALQAIATAESALGAEAQAIVAGEVAHFDFLQFQHLELIRHARALYYPPAVFEPALQSQLQAEAAMLLAQVNALEWVIADLLRAQAMINVLSASEHQAAAQQALAQLSAAELAGAATRMLALLEASPRETSLTD